ncbi:MAG: type IX secretion system membrane protein PorP/SprF [Saprospiraceae bacterium]
MMKKTLTFLSLIILVGQVSFAQQEPMFTKYMFNSLIFNPAYAGSKEHMSLNLLHRTQWYEIDGAPTTQTLTAHTPLRNERVAVGFSMINDKIGPTNTVGANIIYAYRIPLGKSLKLSIGLQGGIENTRADWNELVLQDQVDEAYANNLSSFRPNFGAGFYIYNRNFYIGGSSPHLVETDFRPEGTTQIYARQFRHYYFMSGAAIPLNGDALVFKPSILMKNVGLDKRFSKIESFRDVGAPNEIDFDISFLFQQTLWVGASFRTSWAKLDDGRSSHDSADIWISYLLKNGFRFGAAYDYPVTELSNVTSGAFEIMLGYEFSFDERKVVTPRYF